MKSIYRNGLMGAVLLFFLTHFAVANVTLPRIFTDNMVLQRDVKVPVWGWADKGEKVTVTFAGKKYSATPDATGKWVVSLAPLAAGGPYEMTITGKNLITLKNILMGEVWLCSGQSNMEMPLAGWGRIKDYQTEIANANYPNIRLFTVPKKIGNKPVKDMESGKWEECSPSTIPEFSSVAYFFGRNLNKELKVPIGLINSSWGGTVAETWVSAGAINTMNDFKVQLNTLDGLDWTNLKSDFEKKAKEWDETVEKKDIGLLEHWENPTLKDDDWKTMNLPQLWEAAGLPDFDGVVWFRHEFILDEKEAAAGITLYLGKIDDSDVSFVNGKQIGSTMNKYSEPRVYKVDASLLHKGKNTIAVRIIDYSGGGGIWGEPQELSYKSSNGTVSLADNWRYKPGIKMDSKPDVNIGPNSFPTLLYNGMIYPLLPLAIRGAIWYQGEANASRAYQYQTLFPLLINDWRTQFANPQMPFYFVQLANYQSHVREPAESDWAELREAQAKTLALPNTAMAVIIDIGEANDIHPKNKQDVGYRLSLPALNMIYGKDIVYSGPTYKSMSIEGNKIRLKFDNVGTGLYSKDKYGYLKGFAIAGADKKFVWAKAYIENNEVVVYSDAITNPVAVRYAWANNPDDVNLYNKEGLPASPFRTDTWKGITEN
jgi:Beta-galactosidase/beta-glucuronidase